MSLACASAGPAGAPSTPASQQEPASPAPLPPPPDEAPVSPASDTSAAPAPSPAPEAPAPSEPAPGGKLAWVNPARCLRPCDFHPGAALVRLDDRGAVAAEGAHLASRQIVAPLGELLAAARAAGHQLRINSAFRSYEEQAALFRRIKQPGRAARPGHSEHQLGTAVDLDLPTDGARQWLADNASALGFALSYPGDKQRLTGYRPEPWHLRFVGREVAGELARGRLALEELFRSRADLGESGTCGDCPAPTSRSRCGRITARGSCRGPILSWCYDGALAAVDCSAFAKRCVPAPARGSRGSASADAVADCR